MWRAHRNGALVSGATVFVFLLLCVTDLSASPTLGSIPWQAKAWPEMAAPQGVTALSGKVLTLDGGPLSHVTLSIGDRSTQTDSLGRFLLSDVPSGPSVLVIDGATANHGRTQYGLFEAQVTAVAGQTTPLPFVIWMAELDIDHAVTIPSPTTEEIVVTNPLIPGLEMHIPPGTVIRDRNGGVVDSVSITPIPVERPPFPLPQGVTFPVYYTVQPGGAHVESTAASGGRGIRFVYPNAAQGTPGARMDFYLYEPDGPGWFVYGQGTVSVDGEQIIPDFGVAAYKMVAASAAPSSQPPPEGPPPGSLVRDGDPVDLATGLLVVEKIDFVLDDVVPIVLKRTFRTRDSAIRAFGKGASHSYDFFLAGFTFNYTHVDLVLPDGGLVHYNRTSAGTSYTDAVFENTTSHTEYYRSTIAWNGDGWTLTTKTGTSLVFSRTGAYPLLAVRDRMGNTVTVTRANGQAGGQSGPITRITSPNGRWLQFTYDGNSRVSRVDDHTGRSVTYSYDFYGGLNAVIDASGGLTDYNFDVGVHGPLLSVRDARGILYLTNEYDTAKRVIRQTTADNATYQFAYTVDAGGKIVQTDVTDPRGTVRRVTFNADGYALTDTSALGLPEQQTTTYVREAGTNRVLSATDALGRKTAFAYDATGNVTGITHLADTAEAVTTTLTYEPTFNQVASVTDPLGHVTTYTYDSYGNLQATTSPLGFQTHRLYNEAGQPISVTDPLGHTTQLLYDLGLLAEVRDPLGNRTSRFIDTVGRVLSTTNPLGYQARYDYDALNHLTRVTDALGGVTRFTYDANGNLTSVEDARTNVTTYAYDTMDRLTTRTDPLGRPESHGYDAAGNLVTLTDRKGQTTTYAYDRLNRRTQATYADGSTTSYTYDAGDRLTQIVDSVSGPITRAYDGLDRLTSETTPQGTVSYTYDAAGRRTSMTVAGQATVSYTYDADDRLTQIVQGTNTVAFAYDAAGRRTSLTLPNGVVVEYSYDVASRLTGLTYRNGATTLGTLTYGYDAAGQRTRVGGTWARTGLPQALAAATYNANNQMVTFGAQTLTYDLNGNLTSDGATTYAWDARNRLAGLAGPSTSASFQYDPLGRRTAKTINGSATGFVYDGQNPIQELVGAAPAVNLLTGLGIDEYFVRTDAAGARALLTDALGSTVALADASGAVQTQYTYEPFGGVTSTGSSDANPIHYTGRENDGTGVYYYRARYYSPTLQRFLSEDPVEFAAGDSNLYGYVFNSPTNYTDPTGEFAQIVLGCAVGAVTSGAVDVLSGRKINYGGVALGCAEGALGVGALKALRAANALRAAKALTPGEARAVNKINNILSKNLKHGPKGDISGAVNDVLGSPIPRPSGGYYDHVQDLNNILRGLRNNAGALRNSTNPAAAAAREQAQQAIQQIENAIKGLGL